MTSTETPASFGVHGPGETITRSGPAGEQVQRAVGRALGQHDLAGPKRRVSVAASSRSGSGRLVAAREEPLGLRGLIGDVRIDEERRGVQGGPTLTEDLGHVEVHGTLELGVAARGRMGGRGASARTAAGVGSASPPCGRSGPRARAREQRDERQRLARIPAAAGTPRPRGCARGPSSTGGPRTRRRAAAARRTALAAVPSGRLPTTPTEHSDSLSS